MSASNASASSSPPDERWCLDEVSEVSLVFELLCLLQLLLPRHNHVDL